MRVASPVVRNSDTSFPVIGPCMKPWPDNPATIQKPSAGFRPKIGWAGLYEVTPDVHDHDPGGPWNGIRHEVAYPRMNGSLTYDATETPIMGPG
jgi:hypothetical protein